MAKVYVFLADGFEDIEALIPVDVLRRGGVEVITVSTVEDSQIVTSAHGVQMVVPVNICVSCSEYFHLGLKPTGILGSQGNSPTPTPMSNGASCPALQ